MAENGSVSNCGVMQDDGSIKCWGRNHNGQLGYGDILQRGDNANEMGVSALPGVAFLPRCWSTREITSQFVHPNLI